MEFPIKYALREQSVSNTFTKRAYCIYILTLPFNLVKQNIKRILRSFRYKVSCATLLHSQNIFDPDGVKIHIGLKDSSVSITDKEGNNVKFSAYLVPEVRATLLDVESAFSRRLPHGKV